MILNNFLKKIKILLLIFILFFSINAITLAEQKANANSKLNDEADAYLAEKGVSREDVRQFLNTLQKYESPKGNVPVGYSNTGSKDPTLSSSAAGYYQFTETQVKNSNQEIKRVYGFTPVENFYRNGLEKCSTGKVDCSKTRYKRAIMDLSKREQESLTILMWTTKSGGKNIDWKKIKGGDVNEMYKVYRNLHHGVRSGENRAEDLKAVKKFGKKLEKEFGKEVTLDGGVSGNAGSGENANGGESGENGGGNDGGSENGGGGGGENGGGGGGNNDYGPGSDLGMGDNWCDNPKFADACFDNPFKDDKPQTLKELLMMILQIVIYVSIPLIVLGFVYSGFLFLSGQGKAEDLKKAKTVLVYSIVGAVIIVSAQGIYQFVDATGDAILKDI